MYIKYSHNAQTSHIKKINYQKPKAKNMQVIFNNQFIVTSGELPQIGEVIDEKIELLSVNGRDKLIGLKNTNFAGCLFASIPHSSQFFFKDAVRLDEYLYYNCTDIDTFLIFAQKPHSLPRFKKFKILIDKNYQFSSRFGINIVSDFLSGNLTKSLFLINKNGIITYKFVPIDLYFRINLDELAKALKQLKNDII